NPIKWCHDVGAGGLSNAIPELLHDSGVGGIVDLGRVPSDDPSLSPMQLWCNESQERYVLGIGADRLEEFAALCERERCPFAVVGVATAEERLVVGYGVLVPSGNGLGLDVQPREADAAALPIDLPMDVIFGKPPKMHRDTVRVAPNRWPQLDVVALAAGAGAGTALQQAGLRVLAHPTVASKQFLVTIGDRSVGGLTARDQ